MNLDQWRCRLIGWRNAVLADPRFQRFAARTPGLRGVARSKAGALFDLVAGFTYSQVLAACLSSGLLDHLADGPRSLEEVERHLGFGGKGALALLRAGTALGLIERVGDRWMLGQAGAALRGNPGIAEMVAHHRLLYADLADPLDLYRRGGGGGALSHYWGYAERPGEGDDDGVAGYSQLMAASQPLVAQQIIDAYRFGRHRRMLDIGGGEGVFAGAVRAAHDRLECAVFDLPAVVARVAPRRGDAIGRHGGDFLAGPVPKGYDLITLVRVLHDHDDAPAMRLLSNIAEALAPGDTLLIAEPMADAPGARKMGDGYFGAYLLAMGSGRARSASEIARMARDAGFARARRITTPMPVTLGMVAVTR